jgi:TonB family protein
MTPLGLALNSALLHLVWQGVVVAFLLWIVLAALRKSPSNARYVVSCAALALLAVLPVVTACLAYTSPIAADRVPMDRVPITLAVTAIVRPGPAEFNWLALMQAWLLPVWACGVGVLSMRLLWGCAKVSTLKRTGDPADPAVLAMVSQLSERVGVTRAVRVLISSLADGPSVIGALRPVVLLPAATLLGLTPDQLEAVLAHELAHIRRYDYLVNIVQMLIETLFFYHPAVWWISSRIRQERELCCDDIAVRCCGDAVGYARALTALERIRVTTPSLALGVKDGPLMYRVQRLLGATPQHAPRDHGPARLPGFVAILMALVCLPAGMKRADAQAPGPLPQPKAPVQMAQIQAPLPPGNQSGVKVDLQGSTVNRLAPVPYPLRAQAGNVQGTVYLEVTIDESGDVSDARVLSGPQELRKGALQSVLNWHFTQDAAGSTRQVSIAFQPPDPNSTPPSVRLQPQGIPNGQPGAFIYRPESTIALLDQLNTLKYEQAVASPNGAAQLQETIDSLRASLGDRQPPDAQPSDFAGAPLGDIRILGVTDSERDQLLAKLPLFIRHPLTQDSIAASLQAVREFNSNATAHFTRMGSTQVALIIQVPSRQVP